MPSYSMYQMYDEWLRSKGGMGIHTCRPQIHPDPAKAFFPLIRENMTIFTTLTA